MLRQILAFVIVNGATIWVVWHIAKGYFLNVYPAKGDKKPGESEGPSDELW